MTQAAFDHSDWQAVIDAHRLESHAAAEWLRYGSVLLHSIEPGPEAGKQQQQAVLAFVQAQRIGASAGAVAVAQRQVVLANLRQAPKGTPCRQRRWLHPPPWRSGGCGPVPGPLGPRDQAHRRGAC